MPRDKSQRRIHHSNCWLTLEVVRRKRKTMAIHVLPHTIEVRVPLKCPWLEIDAFIESRLDWMVSARQQLAELPPEPQYLNGECHEFGGFLFPLQIQYSPCNWVEADSEGLKMGSKQPADSAYNQKLYFEFLRRESEALFPDRLRHCLATFPLSVSPTGLRIRRMRARWGSCSERGEICLNSLLVQKDIRAVDLVITHELCHLVHFHHNEEFYGLMDLAMPDWRVRESLLKPTSHDSALRPPMGQETEQLALF